MKIYVDLRMINSSGIGRYIYNILYKNKYTESIVAMGDKNEIKKSKLKIKTIVPYTSKIYGIEEQVKFPYKFIEKESIVHIPHYNIPIFLRGKLITTIHDITHILFPEYLPNKLALYYAKFMISRAVKKSEYILTVSENTKNDLVQYFNADPDKILVTYNGVDERFRKKEQYEYEYLYEKYNIDKSSNILLYVGNKKPHKNISTILKAMNLLQNREKYTLILGGKGFENYKELEDITEKLNLEKQIVHTGKVTDEELINLYNLADIFVFPSFYEGFGIPPLEAMACGTPVICSNTSSLPEVVGDAAYLFDPQKAEELSKAIEVVLKNKDIYSSLVDKGYKRVGNFTWERCRFETEQIYKKILMK